MGWDYLKGMQDFQHQTTSKKGTSMLFEIILKEPFLIKKRTFVVFNIKHS